MKRTSFLSLSLVASAVSLAADEPAPFDRDEFSGRTVTSFEMGYEVIRSRFYNAPKLGEVAPAFRVAGLSRGDVIDLESLHSDKPVVLIFSSYGCDLFQESVDEIRDLYARHRARYDFAMIYTREAHSTDGDGDYHARGEDPKTLPERRAMAQKCRVGLEIPFPIYVDGIDDPVATRWASWPIRVFVVDRGGTVVYAGKPGPWGYKPTDSFETPSADRLRDHPDRFSQESLSTFLTNFSNYTAP